MLQTTNIGTGEPKVDTGITRLISKLSACRSSREERSRHSKLLSALKTCIASKDLLTGKRIHATAIHNGDISNMYVANCLVDMYAKCGRMGDAYNVFDEMQHRNVVSWNTIILGYVKNGESNVALRFYSLMRDECTPTRITFIATLKACAGLALEEEYDGKSIKLLLDKGKAIHSQAQQIGCDANMFVASSIVDMYAKCGSMLRARQIFDSMACHDVVSWSSLILGYTDSKEGKLALELFLCMQLNGCEPNARTFVAALKACISFAEGKRLDADQCLKIVKAVHFLAEKNLVSDIFVANTLVDVYAKCGSILYARQVFDKMLHPDSVSWTALLLGYVESGEYKLVLQLFAQMQSQSSPNARTSVAALKACTGLALKEDLHTREKWLLKGIVIHSQAVAWGYAADIFLANTLLNMYAKCGRILKARQVFEKMQVHNLVSWNAMILGYVENGNSQLALRTFVCMQDQGFRPNVPTFLASLKACNTLVALETGRRIHAEICRLGLASDIVVVNCLIDFYGRCGDMACAQEVFDSSSDATRTIITWSSLMAGYSHQGDTERVFELFETMQRKNLRLDSMTFISVLTACNHAGLTQRGRHYFKLMHKYGITPDIRHFTCMIDILGRSKKLDEAVNMLKNMPIEANVVTWMTVLSACCKWRNIHLGKLAFDNVMRLDGKQSAAYVLMSNIYASASMWKERSNIQEIRRNARV